MWDTAVEASTQLSHDLPCARCGHGGHHFLPCDHCECAGDDVASGGLPRNQPAAASV